MVMEDQTITQNWNVAETQFRRIYSRTVSRFSSKNRKKCIKIYGIVYQQNAHVFDEYFSALREYFRYGRVDVNEYTFRHNTNSQIFRFQFFSF